MENWYIYIYDKDHVKLDEIYEISNISYTKTLNGICSATITIPSKIPKNTENNIKEYNHIEIYKIVDGIPMLLWWGVIASWTPNNNFEVEISCLGYFYLLSKRIFREDKEYSNKKYNVLCSLMLDYINNINDTGIRLGISKDSSLKTTRKINYGDYLWDKLTEYLEDSNTYAEIDKDRKLNYYDENYCNDKSDFYEINEANIINNISINRESLGIYNYIEGISTYTNDSNNEVVLKCVKKDEDSIKEYGLLEYTLKLNDIRLQETLETRTQEYLNKNSVPNLNIMLQVRNCSVFNIYDINVGDIIYLNLKDVFNINTKIKVIEITVNAREQIAELTLGNTLYREVAPQKRVYVS